MEKECTHHEGYLLFQCYKNENGKIMTISFEHKLRKIDTITNKWVTPVFLEVCKCTLNWILVYECITILEGRINPGSLSKMFLIHLVFVYDIIHAHIRWHHLLLCKSDELIIQRRSSKTYILFSYFQYCFFVLHNRHYVSNIVVSFLFCIQSVGINNTYIFRTFPWLLI